MNSPKKGIIAIIILFILCSIPLIYINFFTQDRFVSESQFSIVVEETSNADASMGLLAVMGGVSNGSIDTQSAIGFIHSADLLLNIEKEFSLIEHYTSPKKDVIFRLAQNPTLEERLEFYRTRILAEFDQVSGLIHLTVDSFSPELSYKMSQSILSKTEIFINDLNKEVAEKRLKFATEELKRAQENIKDHEKALLNFQNEHKIIHPEAIIQAQLTAIQSLRVERINRSVELSTLRTNSPNSPSIRAKETIIAQLASEISTQEEALSGPDHQKLNQLLAQYKELQLNIGFAVDLRKGAEFILEKTRSEAISTSRFFSVIQNPYLSEEQAHPRRLYLSISSVLIILLCCYVIQAVIASIYDRV